MFPAMPSRIEMDNSVDCVQGSLADFVSTTKRVADSFHFNASEELCAFCITWFMRFCIWRGLVAVA
jgi:hypothetical protein